MELTRGVNKYASGNLVLLLNLSTRQISMAKPDASRLPSPSSGVLHQRISNSTIYGDYFLESGPMFDRSDHALSDGDQNQQEQGL